MVGDEWGGGQPERRRGVVVPTRSEEGLSEARTPGEGAAGPAGRLGDPGATETRSHSGAGRDGRSAGPAPDFRRQESVFSLAVLLSLFSL